MLQSKSIQIKKIFEDQVISKVNEDRHQMIGSTSEWAGSSDQRTDNSYSSVVDLKANQKKMLEGKKNY